MADNLPAMNFFRKNGDKYTYNGIEMTKEELAEFYCEYTEWSERNKQPDEDRPLYIWLR